MQKKALYIKPIRNLFLKNLAVKKHENVLIFTDVRAQDFVPLREIAKLIAEEGEKFANIVFHIYPATGSHGAEPPLSLWELAFGEKIIGEFKKQKILTKLLKKKVSDKEIELAHRIVGANPCIRPNNINAVIALSHFSTTHTNFRKLLTQSMGVRYASMPHFDPKMLLGPMDIDLKKMSKITTLLAQKLSDANTAEITTKDGTNLRFSLEGRAGHADTGILTKPGSMSNLPAGEAYIAPVEGTAEGRLVINLRRGTKSCALTFEIENGKIKNISGDNKQKERLEKVFKKFPKARVLAEFGIGTNEKAKNPDNTLEAEKILGTIHIAFGDNSTFGGKNKVPFHEDFVVFKPTVKLYTLTGNTGKFLSYATPFQK